MNSNSLLGLSLAITLIDWEGFLGLDPTSRADMAKMILANMIFYV